MKDNSIKLSLTAEDYISLARKSSSKSIEREMAYLHKAIDVDANCVEAHILLGDCFSRIGELSLSNIEFFKAFMASPNDDQLFRINLALGTNALHVGNVDLAAYYADFLGGDYTIQTSGVNGDEYFDDIHDLIEHDMYKYKLIKPVTAESYNAHLMEQATRYIREQDINKALDCLNKVSDDVPEMRNEANALTIYCYIFKDNIDGAIYLGEEYLKKNRTKEVMIPLVEAYLIADKRDEAKALVYEMHRLSEDDENTSQILYFCLRLRMDDLLCEISESILNDGEEHMEPIRLLYAVTLWNLGKKDESRRQFGIIKNKLGSYFFDDYYQTEVFKIDVDSMTYPRLGSMALLPVAAHREMEKDVAERLKNCGKADAFEELIKSDTFFKKELDYVFQYGDDRFLDHINKLTIAWFSNTLFDYYKRALLFRELDYYLYLEYLSHILYIQNGYNGFINSNGRIIRYDVKIPRVYAAKLPYRISYSIVQTISILTYGNDRPMEAIDCFLNTVLPSFVRIEGKKLVWKNNDVKRITRIKDFKSLSTVFVARVDAIMDGDELAAKEDAIKNFNPNKKFFNTYYDVLFGKEGDENEINE